jgi:glycine cleavage system T protein (aminomethyltransferase)
MARWRTPLHDEHVRLGARLVDFAGWDMPLQYTGVVGEHMAVRAEVGVFDVSHLGKLLVSGNEASAALDHALTADVSSLAVGRATYSLVLDHDGGCIDDVFLYRLEDQRWMIVPNAANVSAVAGAVRSAGVDVADERDRWAILAIQGPKSFELFERLWPSSGATDLALHAWSELDLAGASGLVARTGYTGEKGFELFAPADVAAQAFRSLLENGGEAVGLGARDTLRLEMGYALYGHEIGLDINPLEAGLGWTLDWDSPFRGRDALARVRAEGAGRRLVGIRCTGRGVPRQGHPVSVDGKRVGAVTSGNFSPVLRTGIALALCDTRATLEEGAEISIDARGRNLVGIIVRPPFVRRGQQRVVEGNG